MSLSGQQREKLKEALIDAFPTKSTLEQMLSFGLNKNLEVVAGGGNLGDVVFNLITVAESQGWIDQLIHAACKQNTGNLKLQGVARELLSNYNSKSNPTWTKNESQPQQVKRPWGAEMKIGSQPQQVKTSWDAEMKIGLKPARPVKWITTIFASIISGVFVYYLTIGTVNKKLDEVITPKPVSTIKSKSSPIKSPSPSPQNTIKSPSPSPQNTIKSPSPSPQNSVKLSLLSPQHPINKIPLIPSPLPSPQNPINNIPLRPSPLPSPQNSINDKAKYLQDKLIGTWVHSGNCKKNYSQTLFQRIITFNNSKTISEISTLTTKTDMVVFRFMRINQQNVMKVIITYEWDIVDNLLYMKIVDRNISVEDFLVDDKSVYNEKTRKTLKDDLGKRFSIGVTSIYKILSIQEDLMKLEKIEATTSQCNESISNFTKIK